MARRRAVRFMMPLFLALVLASVALPTQAAGAKENSPLAPVDDPEPDDLLAPSARCCMAMAWFPELHKIVMYGGIDSNGNTLADTWVLNSNQTWSRLCVSCLPGTRGSVRMAYFKTAGFSGRMVMFGGRRFLSDPLLLADTWIFSGTNWQLCDTCLASVPSRSSQAMVYDEANDETVMFAGNGCGTGVCGDIWTFDGTNWTQCTPPTGCTNPQQPTGRASPTLAWDGTKVVMFGGKGTGATDFKGDTWFWSGTDWTECTSACATSPSPRYGHRMESDPAESTVVLFGGSGSSGLLSDTWYWNGSSWCGPLCPTTGNVSARCCGGLAYFGDAVKRVFLFSGSNSEDLPTTIIYDLWGYQNRTWTCLAGCL